MATWRVGAARDLPIEDGAWDGGEAKARVFTWAGWPDNPDPSKARQAFLIYDADAPELKGSYKLPFADTFDGELRAVTGGLRAAASRLPQTDAPQEALDRARAVLDSYFARLDEEDEDEDEDRGQNARQIFACPARVLTLQPGDADRLLALAQAQAFDPALLTERTPFFWPAEISSNRLDAYYTRMAPSSLRNYAADAAAGVSFQNSHRTFELGFGRSLSGQYVEEGELARVLAEFYTIPGLRLHDVTTDDFILGVRSGLIKDVSIGFYDATFRCSICGRDIWDWDCPHIPGVKYPVRDALGDVSGEELAFAWVENARLSEVSAVYDGATPGAAILKAQQEAAGGRLRPEIAQLLEARYRVRFPSAGRRWPGATLTPPHAPDTGGERVDYAQMLDDVRRAAGWAEDADPVAGVQALMAEVARLRPCEQRAQDAERQLAELRTLAEDGRQYRRDLVAEALAEGVRAMGAGFATETYQGILEAAPLATLKRMRDDWRAVGDKLFPGGRQTVAEADKEPEKQPALGRASAGDAAFRGV